MVSLVAVILSFVTALVWLTVSAAPAAAQQDPAVPGAASDPFHYITGFRSARFGMAPDEVRAAIVQDFGVPEDAIEEILNLEQGTTVLAVVVPSLSPGPGPASIFYIFGATSGKLDYINVIWTTSETPTDLERERIAVAGLQLAYYFDNLHWKPDGRVSGVSLDPGEVLTFAGVDPKDSGVQVIITGVPMTDAEGNPVELSGPATLQISYSARFGAPDVSTIEPGAF